MTKLKNKTIWITGASSGIGEQLTYQLAERGNNLILSARRKEALEAVKSNCTEVSKKNIHILPSMTGNILILSLINKHWQKVAR